MEGVISVVVVAIICYFCAYCLTPYLQDKGARRRDSQRRESILCNVTIGNESISLDPWEQKIVQEKDAFFQQLLETHTSKKLQPLATILEEEEPPLPKQPDFWTRDFERPSILLTPEKAPTNAQPPGAPLKPRRITTNTLRREAILCNPKYTNPSNVGLLCDQELKSDVLKNLKATNHPKWKSLNQLFG